MAPRLDFSTLSSDAYHALLLLERHVRASGLEPGLLHLIKLRASYINGCAYCVDMHTKDARLHGETEQRLFAVPVWHETPFFSERERAALLWTETVTNIGQSGAPDDIYARVRAQFSDAELVNLTMAIVAINGWNRLAISFRAEPGSYTPPAQATSAAAR